MRNPLLWLCMLAIPLIAGGTGCRLLTRVPAVQAPVVFQQPPTRDQVIAEVRRNTASVQQLSATGATLSIPGMPSAQANLFFEAPRRLRITAKLMGPLLDMGSNNDVFWLWSPRLPQRATYFVRHDQYSHSAARSVLPVRPDWLIEALGLVQFSPQDFHDGPYPAGPGRLEIRSTIATPDGPLQRIVILDDKYGWVLEQQLFDARGQLLGRSQATNHTYTMLAPQHGVSLPRQIHIELPPAQMEFTLSIRSYQVNQLMVDSNSLWTIPQHPGYPLVNLAGPTQLSQSPPSHLGTRHQTFYLSY